MINKLEEITQSIDSFLKANTAAGVVLLFAFMFWLAAILFYLLFRDVHSGAVMLALGSICFAIGVAIYLFS